MVSETIRKLNNETIEITRVWTETKDKFELAKAQIEAQVEEAKAKIDSEVKPQLEQLNEMLSKFDEQKTPKKNS